MRILAGCEMLPPEGNAAGGGFPRRASESRAGGARLRVDSLWNCHAHGGGLPTLSEVPRRGQATARPGQARPDDQASAYWQARRQVPQAAHAPRLRRGGLLAAFKLRRYGPGDSPPATVMARRCRMLALSPSLGNPGKISGPGPDRHGSTSRKSATQM